MEFKHSVQQIDELLTPCVVKWRQHFLGHENIATAIDYYSFSFGCLHAKFRRLGYFVPECETLLKEILYDQLTHYTDLYNMDVTLEEVPTEADVETEDQVQVAPKS